MSGPFPVQKIILSIKCYKFKERYLISSQDEIVQTAQHFLPSVPTLIDTNEININWLILSKNRLKVTLLAIIVSYGVTITYYYQPQAKFGPVMFLHLSVSLFTGGSQSRGISVLGDLCPGGSLSGGISVRESLSGSLSPGRCLSRRPPTTPPHPYGGRVGGTHPTGMHTCL